MQPTDAMGPPVKRRVSIRLVVTAVTLVLFWGGLQTGHGTAAPGFAKLIAELSEPGGSFDIDTLLAYIDKTPVVPSAVPALRARVDAEIRKSKVPLSSEDLATIDRFHRTFIDRGLDLKFESRGRGPRNYYPTYRDLLLETD